MGKFIKAGRVVVLLQGRYSGKKVTNAFSVQCPCFEAIVVKTYDEGTKASARPFGHCLVAGVENAPRKVVLALA
eukprot:502495-Amphidinium_carterae.2